MSARRHVDSSPSGTRHRLASRIRPLWFPGIVGLALLGGCAAFGHRSDLETRIAAARTPDDHVAIARSLLTKASEYSDAAARHRSLAARYETEGAFAFYRHHERSALRMAEHCRMIAERLEGAASELSALAREHERLAAELREEGR